MFLGSKVRPVRGADSLTAIYEPQGESVFRLRNLNTRSLIYEPIV
jgi:hypothetical protein